MAMYRKAEVVLPDAHLSRFNRIDDVRPDRNTDPAACSPPIDAIIDLGCSSIGKIPYLPKCTMEKSRRVSRCDTGDAGLYRHSRTLAEGSIAMAREEARMGVTDRLGMPVVPEVNMSSAMSSSSV
jgi:hypothetical protein